MAAIPPAIPVHGPGISGDVRRIERFPCKALGGERDVMIYLPPGYDASGDHRYPVVYVHDGQNVFDPRTAFLGREWHLDETAERLIREGRVPPFIMVAVNNNGMKRIEEYTNFPDPRHGGGRADAYADFLIREVKPSVDARYRTRADAAHTGVMGSSLGGLVSLYLGWKHPDVFGMVGALSPSLWWADHQLTKAFAADASFQGPERLWIDMGTAEGPGDEDGNGVLDYVDDLRAMRRVLESKGQRVSGGEVEGATHDEPAWADRADEVLEALLGSS